MESIIKFIEGNEYFTDEEIEYIIETFAPKNRLVLIDAREGAGKTKLALAMAYAVSTGSEFLGQKAMYGNIMWFNLDRMFNNDLRERCKELGHDELHWVENISWFTPLLSPALR